MAADFALNREQVITSGPKALAVNHVVQFTVEGGGSIRVYIVTRDGSGRFSGQLSDNPMFQVNGKYVPGLSNNRLTITKQ